MAASGRLRPADREVITSTRWLIHRAVEQCQLPYADSNAGMSLPTVEIMARRMGAGIRCEELAHGTQEIAFPGYFGPPVIVVNRYGHYGMRSIALRHGLAHLVAGELEMAEGGGLRFMSSILDDSTLEERRADLFALADMVPDWWLDELVASGAVRRKVEQELRRHVRALAPEWPASRARDRTRLRLALYTQGR